MKRKFSILVIVLTALMCFLAIGVFAADNNSSSQMPFVETDEIMPEYPDVQTEADLMEEFEEMFGEGGGKILSVALVGSVFMFFFIPALVTVIVFGVLNSKTKKKIKEYERTFGFVPQNMAAYYNANTYNVNYQSQPVNTTNVPMGTVPTGNYVPQNDVNNQQGGSF